MIADEYSLLEMSLSPDGAVLAAGATDGTILLWPLLKHEPMGRLSGHRGGVWSVAFSPDGKTLASGSADGMVSLWSMGSRQLLASFRASEDSSVLAVAFSPDGEILASGSASGEVRLWWVGRQPLASFQSDSSVLDVSFSPDGKTLACGHDNGKIRLWSVDRQDLLDEWRGHDDAVRSVSFSPDGKVLATGGADQLVRLWTVAGGSLESVPSPQLRARACRFANRNLSKAEWRQFMGSDVEYRRTCPEFPSGATATVTR